MPYGEDISEVWVNEGYRRTVEETYNTGLSVMFIKKFQRWGKKVITFTRMHKGTALTIRTWLLLSCTLVDGNCLFTYPICFRRNEGAVFATCLSTGEVPLYEGATFLTERQGGSDVGANETKAVEDGDHFKLYGEKYFASNAGMCGVAMVLARKEGAPSGTKGLTFLLYHGGNRMVHLNGIRIRRLKDKLGVRAVPSAEVEFEGQRLL